MLAVTEAESDIEFSVRFIRNLGKKKKKKEKCCTLGYPVSNNWRERKSKLEERDFSLHCVSELCEDTR